MGRTVPTFRQVIEQELRHWQDVFGRALRKEERAHLERMLNRVRLYIQACTYEAPPHPMDAISLAALLDHEARLRRIEERLEIRLDGQWQPQRLAARSLPLSAGDDAVAADTEPDRTPAD